MRTRFFSLSLAARVMLGVTAIVFLIAIAVTWFIVYKDRESYLADRGALLANSVMRNAERLGQTIDALHRDVLVLARLPPVQGIPRAVRHRGMDPKEGVPIEFWTKRLGEIFSTFAESNPDYIQIRYIGVAGNGKELVRVDATRGRAAVAPPGMLQSKGDKDYFQDTLRLRAGEVHLSKIELNEELGKIQVPRVRTLRAATPVFTPDGDLFGILVINLDIGPAIDAATTKLPDGIRGYLVSSEGDYLAHPDPGRILGFDLARRYTRQQDVRGLQVQLISSAERRPLQAVSTPEGLLHMAAERVQFDPARPERFLLLAWALPDAVIEARLANVRNATFGVMLAIALCVGGVTFLLLRREFVPLGRLTALAENIGAGRYDVPLPEEGAGEMATFVRAFGNMLEGIRAREGEIKQTNAALKASEARFRGTLDNMLEGCQIIGFDWRYLYVNDSAAVHGRRRRDELPGRTMMEVYPGIEDTDVFAAMRRCMTGRTPYHMENEFRYPDGSSAWFELSIHPAPEGIFVVSYDMTGSKEAERRIRRQLEHLNLLDRITRSIGERQDLRSIFQVVVRTLEESLPLDFSCVCLHEQPANALSVMCVGAKSEALALELAMAERASIQIDENGLSRCVGGQLVYEPDIGGVPFPFPQRLARGGLGSLVMAPLRSESRVFGVLVAARREARGFGSVECEFLRQLSEHVALAAHQAQLHGALQQAYDDLRQTQQAVMQQERLRALGQMASGIAHDINNALSPVSLYAESLLETEHNLSERARGYLQTIQRAVEDVAQTVARMREFYRQREPQVALAPLQVNPLVQQVIDLTRPRWSDMAQQRGTVIRAQADLAPDLPIIMGIESEIREALTNLILNAVDAMPEGGSLTLRTRLGDAAEGPERAAVVIEVADEGIGMDDDTRRRCLEPFFTTKGERGTGLGLAMVFGMAQRHSGELEIDSALGSGTTVRLVFAVPGAVATEPGRSAETLELPSQLRLLLIDDDPLLLKSLRDTLEAEGHVIVTVNGGEAGMSAFRASLDRDEPFAAVITDLGMPYVDGRRVAAAVKQASPTTPVILLTGWGQRLIGEGDIPPHVDRILAKPPKLRELREALAHLCRPAAN